MQHLVGRALGQKIFDIGLGKRRKSDLDLVRREYLDLGLDIRLSPANCGSPMDRLHRVIFAVRIDDQNGCPVVGLHQFFDQNAGRIRFSRTGRCQYRKMGRNDILDRQARPEPRPARASEGCRYVPSRCSAICRGLSISESVSLEARKIGSPGLRRDSRVDEIVERCAEIADRRDRDLVNLQSIAVKADKRRNRRGRRARVGKKRIGQIADKSASVDRADDLAAFVADLGFVINEFADARAVIVVGDEKILVREKAGAFYGACENVSGSNHMKKN